MSRTLRILRHRWWAVLAVVAVTMVVAVQAAGMRNDSIEPTYRAEASVTFVNDLEGFEGLGGQLAETVQLQLEDSRLAAIEANQEALSRPGYAVESDPSLGRLTFVAVESDEASARAEAEAMRAAALESLPFDIEGELDRQIDVTLAQLEATRQQIAEVEQSVDVDPEAAQRRDRLTTLLTSLQEQALTLEGQIRVPPTGEEAPTRAELEAELETVNVAIGDVEAELATLPDPLGERSPEATELRALQGQYDTLEVRYQNLLLERADLETLPQLGETEVMDQTAATVPTELVAAAALLLGIALAVFILVIWERMVGPVWMPGDVPIISFLPPVVHRPRSGVSWYTRSGPSRRKAAIQSIRSGLRARASEELVIGVVGSEVAPIYSDTLAVDLAAAFASTAVDTVLIDAAFEASNKPAEFRHSAFTLSDVAKATPDEINLLVDDAISGDPQLQSNLTIVGAGEDVELTVDALAGPRVGHLFDVLRETQDVVIVLCDDAATPSTQALLDRCDLVLLAARPGSSTKEDLIRFAKELTYRHVDLLATLINVPAIQSLRSVTDLRDRWQSWRRRRKAGATTGPTVAEAPSAPAERGDDRVVAATTVEDGHEPTPAERIEVRLENVTLDEPISPPAAEIEVVETRPILAAVGNGTHQGSTPPRVDEMFDLLRAGGENMADQAAAFVTGWVTALVLARPGARIGEESLQHVRTAGFVPLSTWKGHPSVGSRLRQEFRNELDKKEVGEFEQLLLKALSATPGDPSDATSMDRWIARHYFEHHARDRNGEPEVWHVQSPGGTISALVAAERFEPKRMERFVDGVIIRAIERLARRRRRKELVSDDPAIQELDSQIEDARSLGLAIAWLIEGSRPEARLWYPRLNDRDQPEGWSPDWTQGIKTNLAPLQRLGILGAPVLTENELDTLQPSA